MKNSEGLERLQEYLVIECEYDANAVLTASPRELVDMWLTYEGIIGYTNCIINLIQTAYNVKLKDELPY